MGATIAALPARTVFDLQDQRFKVGILDQHFETERECIAIHAGNLAYTDADLGDMNAFVSRGFRCNSIQDGGSYAEFVHLSLIEPRPA